MKILITGDFFVSDNFKGQQLFDPSVIELFESADYRIVNLEAPLTSDEKKNRILKTGPHLRSSADTTLPYLQQLRVDLVTLANNHIMDYGAKGLSDTINCLRENNMSFVGAGKDLREAAKPFTLEKDGLRVAILNFAENEWSIAEDSAPGANPLDIIDNVKQIQEAKRSHDKVLVIIHGGHEYYHYPSPRMAKQYRFYAENGADAIVGHHTHCIGGYEVHQGTPIFYSLGNFVFTKSSVLDIWHEGLLLELNFSKGPETCFKLTPANQHRENHGVGLIPEAGKKKLLGHLELINEVIRDHNMLEKEWEFFLKSKSDQYLNNVSFVNGVCSKYIRAALIRLRIGKTLRSRRYYRSILNLLRCEAHSDAAKEVLLRFLKSNN